MADRSRRLPVAFWPSLTAGDYDEYEEDYPLDEPIGFAEPFSEDWAHREYGEYYDSRTSNIAPRIDSEL